MTRRLMQALLAATALLMGPLAVSAQAAAAPPTPEQIAAREKQAAADAAEWNKIPAPKDPRDFSGVYWTRGYDRTYRQLDRSMPPFLPAAQKEWQRHVDAEKAGAPIADAPTQCFPHGVPRLIASPYPIRFVQTGNEIWMLHEVAHNVRVIHLDKKAPPANTPLSFLGYSVGHWEGDTLVVETTHLNDRTRIDEEAITHGTKLKVTERITKFTNKYGGTELRDLITMDDPDNFTKPWTAERLFPWRGDIEVTEYSCEENNRNAPNEHGVTVAK
jgi:hypothetical protein